MAGLEARHVVHVYNPARLNYIQSVLLETDVCYVAEASRNWTFSYRHLLNYSPLITHPRYHLGVGTLAMKQAFRTK